VLEAPPDGAIVLGDPDVGFVVEPVAADAMPAAPRPVPATRALVISALRILEDLGGIVDTFLELLEGCPRAPLTLAGRNEGALCLRWQLPVSPFGYSSVAGSLLDPRSEFEEER
jgi:hypothetical protein